MNKIIALSLLCIFVFSKSYAAAINLQSFREQAIAKLSKLDLATEKDLDRGQILFHEAAGGFDQFTAPNGKVVFQGTDFSRILYIAKIDSIIPKLHIAFAINESGRAEVILVKVRENSSLALYHYLSGNFILKKALTLSEQKKLVEKMQQLAPDAKITFITGDMGTFSTKSIPTWLGLYEAFATLGGIEYLGVSEPKFQSPYRSAAPRKLGPVKTDSTVTFEELRTFTKGMGRFPSASHGKSKSRKNSCSEFLGK